MKVQNMFVMTALGALVAMGADAAQFNQNVGHGGIGFNRTGFHGASTVIGAPGVRVVNNINIGEFETRSTTAPIFVEQGPSMFYMTPDRRDEMAMGTRTSNNYAGSLHAHTNNQNREIFTRTNATASNASQMHLSNPFWQPAANGFATITDIGFSSTTFDWRIPTLNAGVGGFIAGERGDWTANQTFIKQDVQFGITDDITILGTIKYDWNRQEMYFNRFGGSTSARNNEVGQMGIGVRWRFIDNNDYIGNVTAFYQWNDNISAFGVDGRFGQKFGDLVVYGLGRLWAINWDAPVGYGAFVSGGGNAYYIVMNGDPGTTITAEVGVGAFKPFGDGFSIGGEFIVGHYDWHNRASINATLGYQVSNSLALALYAGASIWTDVSSKTLPFRAISPSEPNWVEVGGTKLSNYQDLSIGVRAKFVF